jgi:hypothetical protein
MDGSGKEGESQEEVNGPASRRAELERALREVYTGMGLDVTSLTITGQVVQTVFQTPMGDERTLRSPLPKESLRYILEGANAVREE